MEVMKAATTARERARAQITLEIKEEARRQLAAEGAQQLSLRAVARALGMVSSALYRYFPSRDDLLTALIIDAYDSLGSAAERAVADVSADAKTGSDSGAKSGARARWRACCIAVRDWAIANPHEYALIYGSPVPGYRAPPETIGPAQRVAAVLGEVLTAGWPRDGAAAAPPAAGNGNAGNGDASREPLPGQLAAQARIVADAIAPGVPAPVLARTLIAWTQLFGMISFELFGQLVGSADPADDFFGYAVERMADLVGLPG
jgi:AcrR family transcriptional regulator